MLGNTPIDCVDGNPRLRAKARNALASWLDRLQSSIILRALLPPLEFSWRTYTRGAANSSLQFSPGQKIGEVGL